MLSNKDSSRRKRVRNRNVTTVRIVSAVRRFGVADDALHGRKCATQRALDLVDVLVNLDDAHRGGGAAMKIYDLAGIGIPNTHVVNVMDGCIGRKPREGVLDGFDALRPRVASQRQFRFERFDVSVDLDILTEFLADVSLQLMSDAVRGGERHLSIDL